MELSIIGTVARRTAHDRWEVLKEAKVVKEGMQASRQSWLVKVETLTLGIVTIIVTKFCFALALTDKLQSNLNHLTYTLYMDNPHQRSTTGGEQLMKSSLRSIPV